MTDLQKKKVLGDVLGWITPNTFTSDILIAAIDSRPAVLEAAIIGLRDYSEPNLCDAYNAISGMTKPENANKWKAYERWKYADAMLAALQYIEANREQLKMERLLNEVAAIFKAKNLTLVISDKLAVGGYYRSLVSDLRYHFGLITYAEMLTE